MSSSRLCASIPISCLLLLPSLALLIACGAPNPGGDDVGPGSGSSTSDGGDDSASGAAPGSGASTGNGGLTNAGGNANAGGNGSGGGAAISSKVLPARIRRLTNGEYNATVHALLGTSLTPASQFPPDSRQQGYTVNEAQRVDPILALDLDAAAKALAAEARPGFGTLAPCADPAAGAATCAESFIRDFGEKAYRRPLSQEDVDSLKGLYAAGAEDASYEDGIELVLRGILQAPGFLYHTEIGPGTPEVDVQLSGFEIASALSYLVTGTPPDATLAGLAAGDGLLDPAAREAQVRRLFATDAGQTRAVQMVQEWLSLDRILQTSKDSTVHPAFGDLRADMDQETQAFVRSILSSSGDVTSLLSSNASLGSDKLKAMYATTSGPERLGLLNQASFLSIFAHAQDTAPVLRGVNVLRRVLCQNMELPTSLNIQIIPPVPDPEKTTRERFTIHATDGICAECHSVIDPIGFSFEGFDAMGAYRVTENNKPVDSTTTISLGQGFDGDYANSNELAQALSGSDIVRQCFGKQIFSANSAEGVDTAGYEAAFREALSALPPEKQGQILEILVAFAKDDMFVKRRAQ
jgi:hypothetical protein